MVVSATAFEEPALNDLDGQWELWNGQPGQTPAMTFDHNRIMMYLGARLVYQLDERVFQVRINAGQVTRPPRNYFIPDVFVFPAVMGDPFRGPLPLVVEVWSPSTGGYDQRVKLAEYQRRGDA